MAEAMLEGEYKISHSDLKEWGDEQEKDEQSRSNRKDEDSTKEEDDSRDDSPPKKFEMRIVQIQLPSPKRQKLCTAFTAKEVVEGKICLFLFPTAPPAVPVPFFKVSLILSPVL
jgi:hypothetical protein